MLKRIQLIIVPKAILLKVQTHTTELVETRIDLVAIIYIHIYDHQGTSMIKPKLLELSLILLILFNIISLESNNGEILEQSGKPFRSWAS